eukprot:COSAG02_NODE_1749_length_11069_cov_88.967274_1_plen_63_part_10
MIAAWLLDDGVAAQRCPSCPCRGAELRATIVGVSAIASSVPVDRKLAAGTWEGTHERVSGQTI